MVLHTLFTRCRNYPGRARRKYCELTGLTPQWVASAGLVGLRTGCANLDIPVRNLDDAEEMRGKITEFIARG